MTGYCGDPMPAFGDDEPGALDHALPTGHIDRLMFGFPGRPDVVTIYNAFVSISMSAQLRGWTATEFDAEVTATKCDRKGRNRNRFFWSHRLWEQLNARSDDARGLLDKAWGQAAINLADEGLHSLEDLRNAAVETAWAWQDRLLAGVDGLDGIEAMVIEYVTIQMENRQVLRVTCPCREVANYANITKNTAYRRLQALTERGLLIQHSRGWYSTDKKRPSRRAAIYSLAPLTGGT